MTTKSTKPNKTNMKGGKMAWEISITSDGWHEIYDKLSEFDIDDLLEAIEDNEYETLIKNAYPGAYHQQIRIFHNVN